MKFLPSIDYVHARIQAHTLAGLSTRTCLELIERLQDDIRLNRTLRRELIPIDQDVFGVDVAIARALIELLEERLESHKLRYRESALAQNIAL